MLLDNYWNLITYISTNLPNQNQYAGVDLQLKNINNESFSILAGPSSSYAETNWSVRYGISLHIGTGTTDPLSNDYCLESDITSSMFNVQQTVNSIYSDGQFRTALTISGNNNTGSSITISEIGVVKSMYKFVAPSSYGATNILLSHDLLENQLIVPNGRGFLIVYDWDQR